MDKLRFTKFTKEGLPRGFSASFNDFMRGCTTGRFGRSEKPDFKQKNERVKEIAQEYRELLKQDPEGFQDKLLAEQKKLQAELMKSEDISEDYIKEERLLIIRFALMSIEGIKGVGNNGIDNIGK